MQIIDGKLVAKSIRDELKAEITEAYEKYGKIFKLTVIIAGNNPASEIYVRNKGKACEDVGIVSETLTLPEDISQEEIERVVSDKVNDKELKALEALEKKEGGSKID